VLSEHPWVTEHLLHQAHPPVPYSGPGWSVLFNAHPDDLGAGHAHPTPPLALLRRPARRLPEAKYATILGYNFSSDLPASEPGYHYEQFATINGSVVSLGSFVVRYDVALSKFDVDSTTGVPFKRRAVVNVGFEAYPEGDPNWGDPKPGSTIYGVLDGSDPGTSLPVGGVELATGVDCSGATEIFITVEPDDRGTRAPLARRDAPRLPYEEAGRRTRREPDQPRRLTRGSPATWPCRSSKTT